MATALAPLPPLPVPQEPVVDQRTGQITRTWFLYFQRLDQHVREIEQRLDAIGA